MDLLKPKGEKQFNTVTPCIKQNRATKGMFCLNANKKWRSKKGQSGKPVSKRKATERAKSVVWASKKRLSEQKLVWATEHKSDWAKVWKARDGMLCPKVSNQKKAAKSEQPKASHSMVQSEESDSMQGAKPSNQMNAQSKSIGQTNALSKSSGWTNALSSERSNKHSVQRGATDH